MNNWLQAITSRPVGVGMLTLAGVLFGFIALGKLPVELLPDITYPSLTIQTELPDAAPAEVEQLITTPLEQVAGVVNGLARYHSSSRPGVSEVTLEFAWGTDMAAVSLDVREKLDLVQLPDDALSPIVYRFEPSLDPVVRVALTGPLPVRDLRRLADDLIKKRLETLDGVAAAKTIGGADEEVLVEVDEGRLDALGLEISDVVQRLREENINRAGGELRDAESAYLLRTVSEFRTLEDIEDTIILDTPEGGRVRLRDIGRAVFGQHEREVRVRVDGIPAVEIHIYKAGDANTVHVARRVREKLDELGEDTLLVGTVLQVLFDQARYIEEAVTNVMETALLGAALAALVLWLFLRDFRSTVLIVLSIPISVAVTFLLMHLSGISLNVMSLGGLALGIGMLVDNSVVVLEAVRRRKEAGADAATAAVVGAGEVVGGIVASTLTTIAVFLPLVFVEGIAGQIFYDQALTVTYSLLASLFVAVTVIPCALAFGTVDRGRARGRGGFGWLKPLGWLGALLRGPARLFSSTLQQVTDAYGRVLGRLPRAVWLAPLVALVLFLIVVPRASDLGTELVPDLAQGDFFYDLQLQEGTPIEITDRKVMEMEAVIRKLKIDEKLPLVEIHATVGGTPVLGDLRSGERRDHIARLHLKLAPDTPRDREQETIARLDAALAEIPNCPVKLGKPSLFSFRDPIEIEVFAPELDELQQATEIVVATLADQVEGLIEPVSHLADPSPEYHVDLDPSRLAALGLSQEQVATVLRAKGIGEIAGQFTHHEKPIDIRVQVIGAREGKPGEVERRSLRFGAGGAPIPLAAIGRIERGSGPVEISHVTGDRAARVTARVEGVDLGAVARRVEEKLAEMVLPPRATARLSGQNEEMRASLSSLRFALLLAVFLVYLVLASTFESLSLPLVIMLTVPLGLIGAVAALWIGDFPLGVLSMIGVIFLSGIVVNNGIIYIGRINQHRAGGAPAAEAVRRAGLERIRPILITSTTTALGLLPLALGLGAGAELRQPMAITVIGGLIVATFLTLFVVPSGYLMLAGRSRQEKTP